MSNSCTVFGNSSTRSGSSDNDNDSPINDFSRALMIPDDLEFCDCDSPNANMTSTDLLFRIMTLQVYYDLY